MKHVATITCPYCKSRSVERMPTNACLHTFVCVHCDRVLRPLAGDCCVFCSYGEVACPPIQALRSHSP